MENETANQDELLSELSDVKARLFIPAFVYVGILMLLGTTGNCMVLYFYGCKIKATPSTSFIFALATFDLASCLVGMPMEIADLRYYFNFKSEPACKILRCVTHFTSISSGLTLVVIAIDRYRRICKPFERQVNNKHVKVICFILGVFSALLSVPAIFFNEIVRVEIPNEYNRTVIGNDCTTTKAEHLKPYMLAFNATYLIGFVLITTILSILYSLIGRQLCRHQKFRSYVAKGGTKVKRITVRSTNETSENLLSYRREASTLSNKVFADPPDATDSIVDMKEFVTRGLTEVETNRPSSGYTTVTGTTGLTGFTGLTDISGRSRRTMQSVKSVTICDPSKNQIIPIEARVTHIKKTISKSESTWSSIEGRRPGSADSFTSVSTRPISPKGTHRYQYTESRIQNENILFSDNAGDNGEGEHVIAGDNDTDYVDNENDNKESTALQEYLEDDEMELPIIEHEMSDVTQEEGEHELCIPDETDDITHHDRGGSDTDMDTESNLQTDNNERDNTMRDYLGQEYGDEEHNGTFENGDEAGGKRRTSNSTIEKEYETGLNRPTSKSSIDNKDNTGGLNRHTSKSSIDNENNAGLIERTSKTSVVNGNEPGVNRPRSKTSVFSDKSKSSKGSKRSAVVTPMSCMTTTSTVASRASTVKRMKRMLNRTSSRTGKMNKKSDSLKELRLKMLDLNTVKYTMIMIVITILFVISFLPYLALVIWRYYQGEHEMNILTDTELVLFQIGIRSIFLNSALNPLIYGGFNSKFRIFFYKILCKCCTSTKRNRWPTIQPRDQSESTSGS